MAPKIALNVTELDTFIEKFKSLWNAGLEAHLDVDTQAGQAWVGLRLRLGHPPGPHHQLPPNFQRNSPSRQRRREKRAAARQESARLSNAEKAPIEETSEKENVAVKATQHHDKPEEVVVEETDENETNVIKAVEAHEVNSECSFTCQS